MESTSVTEKVESTTSVETLTEKVESTTSIETLTEKVESTSIAENLNLVDLKIGCTIIEKSTGVEHIVADIKFITSCITSEKRITTILLNYIGTANVITDSLFTEEKYQVDDIVNKLNSLNSTVAEVKPVSSLKSGSVIAVSNYNCVIIDGLVVVEVLSVNPPSDSSPTKTNLQFKTLTSNLVSTQFRLKTSPRQNDDEEK